MKKIIAQEQNRWTEEVSTWLVEKIKTKNASSLYIPAGGTPTPIYSKWQSQRPAFLKNLKLIQIDDVVSQPQKDMFKKFFTSHLPDYCSQIEFFENGQTQAELGILGLGLNGHVAFHEPELPKNFYSGCVMLSETTCRTLNLENRSWGQTYGLGAFLSCKSLLLVVSGDKKKDILLRTLKRDPAVPASALLDHPDLTILSDFDF